ncbi:DMT family transporter [Vibrio salinus]|uniref:DMT family transporter n=1 Tax=Vibrio salinus TaxID=2899784 RepID=UPI001E642722|nr:DMT family transporter [Vibrio salinus]MCE0494754.1 DMT family transporter [Vibrio salinus]
MMSLEKIAPLLFLFMWSSGAFFVKTGLEFSSVWSFLALRSLGSFCLVLSILFFSDIRTNLKHSLSRNDILMLCLNGLLFQVLYQSFYFLSIHYALAIGLVALILGIQPLITPLFSREKITIKALILLVIAFVGLFISLFGSKDFSSFNWTGLLFAFLAVLSITLGSTYQKKIDVHPAISALVQNAFASIIFLIISLCNGWHVE